MGSDTTSNEPGLQRLRANAIRFLSLDAVEKARSGHPGAPMGLADVAEVLWHQFLKHHPLKPRWPNRDRFVLSNGHASMLLYSLLHLTGYDLTIEDIKSFRQWGSATPGHPERDLSRGVETTTGPLGQGLANAVGMALAEKILASRFNRSEFPILDHFTYVVVGDGCLMEGISHEAASLAGTWDLNKLIVFWDDNGISIDGKIEGWCRDDVPGRFRAYGFTVIENVDGHDPLAVKQAIDQAQDPAHRGPKLICCKTHIAFGAPKKQDTADAHGSPLGEAEIQATRQALGWHHAPFEIPETVRSSFDAKIKGDEVYAEWDQLWRRYQNKYPEEASELDRLWQQRRPENFEVLFEDLISDFEEKKPELASRQASQMVLNHIAPQASELLGGSADLTPSNGTFWKGATVFSAQNPAGQYIHYGVREFAMTAVMNGLALHGEWVPYGGTFLTFCDYARNAIRMSALMELPVVAVYTHDSIGLGEDGPTHQPIEHLNMLRMTPHLDLWRPMDATETAVAWRAALRSKTRPTALALSRQKLKWVADRSPAQLRQIEQGGYILWEAPQDAVSLQGILIATGSEVSLAYEAAQKLWRERGISLRVVSMPSADVFLRAPIQEQQRVLPPALEVRVAVEAGSPDYWYRFVGLKGRVVGLSGFGASAPAEILYHHFGLTVERIMSEVLECLEAQKIGRS